MVGNKLRTLRGKFIILTLLVVLGTQVTTVIAVLIAANRDIDARAEENLRDGSQMLRKIVDNRAELLRRIVQPLAADANFQSSVKSRNIELVTTELANRAVLIGADVAVAIDKNGAVVGSSGGIIPTGFDLQKLTESDHATLELNGKYYEIISLPLDNETAIGWVAMGFALDDGIAQRFAATTGLEMTLMATYSGNNSEMLGSSLSRENRALITTISDEIANGMRPQEAQQKMREEFLSVRVPYLDGGDQVFVVMQEPIAEAMEPFKTLAGTLLHAAATALICALFMAFYLSRSISRPVRRLLIAARRMRIGNYSLKLGIDSKDEFGELAKAFDSMRESIAEREQRIIYQAQFDSLTGLPNRNQSMDLLRNSLRIATKTGNPVAVMIMHLQRFREIQSSLGHEIGDQVLRRVAERMDELLPDGHVLARLEGDQFLIIAPNTDRAGAKERAKDIASNLDKGLNVQSVNVTLDACIGVCIAPEHGTRPDELLRRAAVAKNDAQKIQNRIQVYQNGREARHMRQLAILGDLRNAADENELQLYLQPKISLSDTVVCGAEALLRWEHPELGQVPPHEFIPLAESAGNISIVTEWVIEKTLQQLAVWNKIGIDLPIAINLSRRDLLNQKLPEQLRAKLDQYKVQASAIVLEITEEAVVQDIDSAITVLEQLRSMGISISMDDFGTGYSSLSHLQKLPVDELKIDRSFIINLPDERQNAAIVRSIIELAHNLALEVVAEGVETTAALRWLREEGCERAQGYYLSKPMPAQDFEEWLGRWERLGRDMTEQHDPGESLILRPRLIT